ncbi:putative oxidoreductase, partial [Clostridium tetanomorphum DSM 665]
MKKLVISCLLVVMTLSLTACGSKNNNASNSTKQEAELQDTKGSFGDLKTMPEFKVNDVNDKVVTNDIFKDKKLTMINIWGTFCKPCIDEMPELQDLYNEYGKKDVNIIGVVADGDTNEVKALLFFE